MVSATDHPTGILGGLMHSRPAPPLDRRNAGRRLATTIALVLTASLALVGCAAPAETTTRNDAESVEIPATTVGEKAQWFIELLNADDDVNASQLEPEFSEEFLAEVPVDDFAEQLNKQFRPAKPFVPTAYEGSELEAVMTLAGAIADPFEVVLTVDEDGTIIGMFIRPASEP